MKITNTESSFEKTKQANEESDDDVMDGGLGMSPTPCTFSYCN